MGFPRPEALLVGASALLPLILLSSLAAGRKRLVALLGLVAAVVGAPIAVAPGRVQALASAITSP
jgi:hypothetical protein